MVSPKLPSGRRFVDDQRGAVLVEYALIVSSLVLVGAQIVGLLTTNTTNYQNRAASEIGREQVWLPNTTVPTTATTVPPSTASTLPPTTTTTAPTTTSTTAPTTTTVFVPPAG